MLALYRTLTVLGGPLITAHLHRRRFANKEDPRRFTEKMGRASVARPRGHLIWLHGASVGESLSLLPLIERLLQRLPDCHILITSGTLSSAKILAQRLPKKVLHQFLPLDRPGWVRRFLDHWRPDLILWAESDLWPNMLTRSAAAGIPMILINGRMSSRSFRRWRSLAPGLARKILAGFDLCLTQTTEDGERYATLGAKQSEGLGDLKLAAAPLPADPGQLADLVDALSGRPVWMAASTHPGEEEICGRCQLLLKERHRGLLTLLVPRHPQRGADIADILRARGLIVARRSMTESLRPDTDIYLVDTMGELGLFYRASPIVFMGKSLVATGGQNPLEAARLDCALLYGPHMTNFAAIVAEFDAANAAITVADEADLTTRLDGLLAESARVDRLATAARKIVDGKGVILETVMARLDPYLEALK